MFSSFNPLSINPTKWSNKLKQFVGNFVKLALKGLRNKWNVDFTLKYFKHWIYTINPFLPNVSF